MQFEKALEKLAERKNSLFLRYSIKKLGIFGAGKKENNSSEKMLNVFVEFKQPIGLRFIDLEDELEKLLNAKVYLINKNGININYLKAIRKEVEYV